MKITEMLAEKGFLVSVEIVPPRNGTAPEKLFSYLETLRGKVDFVSVTKGAGGSLRGGTLPIAHLCQSNYGLPAVAHFVCREHNRQEIENELADLEYLKIENILALRGDAPAGQKDAVWDGDYKHAYLLVRQIAAMNRGEYLPRVNVDEEFRKGFATDFCILVAGHPEDPEVEEIAHIRAKIEAGAQAIITQMIFSFEEYDAYVKMLRKHGITLPVIAGIRPLVTIEQAESAERFFNLTVPAALKEGLRSEGRAFGIRYAADAIKRIEASGGAGAHLFVLNDENVVKELLEELKKMRPRPDLNW